MNVLDLFSGIGGFSLGLHRAGMTTVAFCEIEPYPQAVLRKNFPGVPIYEDVRTLTAERLRTDGIDRIDVICGGFPCQPFSNAGKQRGTEDHRHLWPEMLRLVQECKPTWVIGENVAGFVNMALDDVSADLENAGYEVQPFVIPACAVGAPHRRDRVWILAYASGRRCGKQNEGEVELKGRTESVSTSQTVADSDALRKLQPQGCQQEQRDRISTAVRMWPTPLARDCRTCGGGQSNELPRTEPLITEVAKAEE